MAFGSSLWVPGVGSMWNIPQQTQKTQTEGPLPLPQVTGKASKEASWTTGGLSHSLRPVKSLISGLALTQGWRICPLPSPPFFLILKQGPGHKETKFRFGDWLLPLKPEESLPPHWAPLVPFCQDTDNLPQSLWYRCLGPGILYFSPTPTSTSPSYALQPFRPVVWSSPGPTMLLF